MMIGDGSDVDKIGRGVGKKFLIGAMGGGDGMEWREAKPDVLLAERAATAVAYREMSC